MGRTRVARVYCVIGRISMRRKRRAGRTKPARKKRRPETRGGYTTDKRLDVSKLRFPYTRPATPAELAGTDPESD